MQILRISGRWFWPIALICAANVHGQGTLYTASGTDAEIAATLNDFRNALGPLNPNSPGSFGDGRREINWDGLPDDVCAPNLFPPDFLNAPIAGRARGVVFRTPGPGFQVSAAAGNLAGTPPDFANLNPQYVELFQPFSGPRMFTVLDFITGVDFFVPGSDQPATVSGFGVVFCDVDRAQQTELFFINREGELIATAIAPPAAVADGGKSFVGMIFDQGQRVARVGILSGNTPMDGMQIEDSESGNAIDLVVMDDFVYGEPISVATPCVADLDDDTDVDLSDLAHLLGHFGTPAGAAHADGDLDRDADVDLSDLTALLSRFGQNCS